MVRTIKTRKVGENGEVRKLRFHKFPEWEKDQKLCKKWMIATRLLNLKKDMLKFTYLCEEHFTPSDYNNPLDPTSRLKKAAVPSVFVFPQHLQKVVKERKSPKKRPFPFEQEDECIVECIEQENQLEEKKEAAKLAKELEKNKQKIKHLQQQLRRKKTEDTKDR